MSRYEWDRTWAVVETYDGLPDSVWVACTEKRAELLATEIAEEQGLDYIDGYWQNGHTELHIREARSQPKRGDSK